MDGNGGKKTLQDFCEEYVLNLLGSFEGVDDEVKNVGKKFYLYDRMKFVKTTEMNDGLDNVEDLKDTDEESVRTLIIQEGLFKQQIHSDKDGRIVNRTKMKILDGVKDVRFR